MAHARQELGTLGEQAAAGFLIEQGYGILNRNYRVRGGELDLVCSYGRTLVFVEVKTRTSALFGLPEEAVTFTKRSRIRRLAAEYLQREGIRWGCVRFDVVSVTVSQGRVAEIRHIPGAF